MDLVVVRVALLGVVRAVPLNSMNEIRIKKEFSMDFRRNAIFLDSWLSVLASLLGSFCYSKALIIRSNSSGSKVQSGGRSFTKRGVAPERIASGP